MERRRPLGTRSTSRRVLLARLVTAALVLALLVTGVLVVTRTGKRRPDACRVAAGSTAFALGLSQAENATTIAAVGKRLGLPDHAVTVALAAALQESRLENLPGGDRDSVGLFQQRPSQGWGSVTQLMNPTYAAGAFYGALEKVSGWADVSVTEAAQRVQRSDAPDAYARWEAEARILARALTGEVPAGLTCHFARPLDAPAGRTVRAVLASELGSPGVGVPVSAARGWTIASWLVGHASAYDVRAVSFAGRRWTPSTGRWDAAAGAGDSVEFRVASPSA